MTADALTRPVSQEIATMRANAIAIQIGQRFGRLIVVGGPERGPRKHLLWRCRCDCGGEALGRGAALNAGGLKSCGCWEREIKAALWTYKKGKHLHTRRGRTTAEYRAWAGMISRCTYPNEDSWVSHGGRGITVCERWRGDFRNFLADMGLKPSPQHSLDRVNNDGNYEPSNCRWATRVEQANNKRNNHKLSCNGETLTIAQWARKIGVPENIIGDRLRRGWSEREAIEGRRS